MFSVMQSGSRDRAICIMEAVTGAILLVTRTQASAGNERRRKPAQPPTRAREAQMAGVSRVLDGRRLAQGVTDEAAPTDDLADLEDDLRRVREPTRADAQ